MRWPCGRFETPPGKQAQVDWGHLGSIEIDGVERKLSGFSFTLGYSRMMMAQAALSEKLGTVLRLHEEAFRQLGGVPEEILYDRMRTVWMDIDDRGEIVWNPVFLDFARYWGFTPRLCRPYRAQTKGKVESGIKYVRRNFLCGLLGREPASLDELNAELRAWSREVANVRLHGTTHEQPVARWPVEQQHLKAVDGMPCYEYLDEELRRVSRDAYVSWDASRYSVPWSFAGKRSGCANAIAAWKCTTVQSESRATIKQPATVPSPSRSTIAGFRPPIDAGAIRSWFIFGKWRRLSRCVRLRLTRTQEGCYDSNREAAEHAWRTRTEGG